MSTYSLNREFFDRTRDKVLTKGMFTSIPDWIINNTKLLGKKWSFFEHEFQLEIARSEANKLVVIKPSQVGLSELSVRVFLAFLAMHQGSTGIYVLPHIKQAGKFAKARLDPVIENSPRLSQLVITAANSNEFKRIGQSNLYMGGATTGSQAISIPSQINVYDEYDFGNPDILGTYESRLSHNKNGGFRRLFSTPTVDGYGVAMEYSLSSQARYACKCEHCEKWAMPSYFDDVIIPGLADGVRALERSMLHSPTINLRGSWIKCPHCGKPLEASLGNFERREWVHKYPDNPYKGHAVKSFDVIAYNPIYKTLMTLESYRTQQLFFNYGLGETFKSDLNQVDISKVVENTIGNVSLTGDGMYMGVDVGKHRLHVVVGKRVNGRVKVANFFVLQREGIDTAQELEKIFTQYNCLRMVIDASPDYYLCQTMSKMLGGQVNACIYTDPTPKNPSSLKVNQKNNDVLAIRVEVLDTLVKQINSGNYEFPNCPELEEVKRHLQQMKRVDGQLQEDGTQGHAYWRKLNDDDHFFHALNYLQIGLDIDDADESGVIIAPLGISYAKLQTSQTSGMSILSRRAS